MHWIVWSALFQNYSTQKIGAVAFKKWILFAGKVIYLSVLIIEMDCLMNIRIYYLSATLLVSLEDVKLKELVINIDLSHSIADIEYNLSRSWKLEY